MGDDKTKPGQIIWTDLTVPNAGAIRDFYQAVVGWEPADHPVDTYTDFDMRLPGSNDVVTGICHAIGQNADIPAQWMIYIAVADLDESLGECKARGGTIIKEMRNADAPSYAIIRDPAGAVATLYEIS